MSIALAVLIWTVIVVVSMVVVTWLATRWGRDPFGWSLLAAVMGPLAIIGMLGQRRSDVERPQAFERHAGDEPRERTVVAAVDGSAASERVARHAAASAGDGDVAVVVVLPHEARPRADESNEQHQRAVEQLTAGALRVLRDAGVTARVVVAYGNPGEEILRLARDEDATLIVTGRRGSGLSKALLGSVSDHVVKNADRNVAVVE